MEPYKHCDKFAKLERWDILDANEDEQKAGFYQIMFSVWKCANKECQVGQVHTWEGLNVHGHPLTSPTNITERKIKNYEKRRRNSFIRKGADCVYGCRKDIPYDKHLVPVV